MVEKIVMNEPVITLSDAAQQHIEKMLAAKKNACGFRLSVKKVGCSGFMYVPEIIEQANPDDLHFTAANQLQIFIEKKWERALRGTVVDLTQKGLGQTQLVFQNPNVIGECGCGESFHLPEEETK
jgi:iron-sulfur cluster assembly accessory protein